MGAKTLLQFAWPMHPVSVSVFVPLLGFSGGISSAQVHVVKGPVDAVQIISLSPTTGEPVCRGNSGSGQDSGHAGMYLDPMRQARILINLLRSIARSLRKCAGGCGMYALEPGTAAEHTSCTLADAALNGLGHMFGHKWLHIYRPQLPKFAVS